MVFILLASAGYDHTIRFWDAQTAKPYRSIQHKESQVNRLEITPDKKYLAAAANPAIKFYEVRSNNPNAVLSFTGHSTNVTSLGFHHDGKWMFSASEDTTVKIWDLASGNTHQREYKQRSAITSAALHPNQAEIICGCQDGSVRIIDLVAGKVSKAPTIEDESSIRCVAISPDGKLAAACDSDGYCYVWSMPNASTAHMPLLHKIKAHQSYVLRCTFSPNSQLLCTTSADSTVKVWDVSNMQDEKLFEGHQMWVWDATFSADSGYLLTAGSDKTIRLWDVAQGDTVRQYIGHSRPVSAVALNDDVAADAAAASAATTSTPPPRDKPPTTSSSSSSKTSPRAT